MTVPKTLIVAMGLLFASPLSFAKILVNGVSGASSVELPANTTSTTSTTVLNTNLVIYGGLAGPPCTTVNNISPCDNCAQVGPLKKCNRTRIYPSLKLQIQFQSDTKAGRAVIAKDTTVLSNLNASSGAQGTAQTVEISWLDLCNQLDSQNCGFADSFKSENLKIGIDETNDGVLSSGEDFLNIQIIAYTPGTSVSTDSDVNSGDCANTGNKGICDFAAYPGDEKVYIDPIDGSVGFPNSDNVKFQSVLFLVSEDNFACSPSEGSSHPIAISALSGSESEFSISNKIIDGLNNGSHYYFRVATIDKAGNIANFMADSAINTACNLAYNCSGSRDVSTVDMNCPYMARPDEVLGLLSEDFNCFIATASYGSPWDHRLVTFRQFRSEILRSFPLGKKLVNYYYKQGPYFAKWIVDHPEYKTPIRILLWPAWVFAWLSLKVGFAVTLLLSALVFAGSIFSLRYLIKTHLKGPSRKAYG